MADDDEAVLAAAAIRDKLAHGQTLTHDEAAAAAAAGIRVPVYLRPDEEPDEERLDVEQADQHVGVALEVAPGMEWLQRFYEALGGLGAQAAWLAFAFGQIGASMDDPERLEQMLTEAATDIADVGAAAQAFLAVAMEGLTNARENSRERADA